MASQGDNTNRVVVGTSEHACVDCGEIASFYQVQKGKRRGYLYKRCGCGADQSTGKAKQQRWAREMIERQGVEKLPYPALLDISGDTAAKQAIEPDSPPEADQDAPEPPPEVSPPAGGGLWGFLLVAGAAAAALMFAR